MTLKPSLHVQGVQSSGALHCTLACQRAVKGKSTAAEAVAVLPWKCQMTKTHAVCAGERQ